MKAKQHGDSVAEKQTDRRTASILVVDDSPIGLQIVLKYLQAQNFIVMGARSGEHAFEALRQSLPDLILLDILMPGMDGFEVCRRLKSSPATRDIPVIFMTSLESEQDKVKAFEAGGVDYVLKPILQGELLARVRTHLTMRSLVQSLQEKNELLEDMAAELTDANRKFQQAYTRLQHSNRKLEASYKTEVKRSLQLQISSEVAQQVTSILKVNELLAQVVYMLSIRLDYYCVGIWLINEQNDALELKEMAGEYPANQLNRKQIIPIETHQSIVVHVYHTKQYYTANDVTHDDLYRPYEGLPDTRAELAIPLKFASVDDTGMELFGVLDIQSNQANAFDAVDVMVMESIANQLAIALRNANVFEQTKVALQETQGLFQAARTILGTSDIQNICRNFLYHFRRLVHSEVMTIYLLDHEKRTIIFKDSVGKVGDMLDRISYPELEAGIAGICFRSGEPVLSLHADDGIEPEATRMRRKQCDLGALIVVPLISRERIIGVAMAANYVGQRAFTDHDVDLLMALATQAATAIENVRFFEEAHAAREEAERSNTAKSQFLANMSHELRTPLNGILGYAQILKQDSHLTPRQQDGLDIIYSSGEHLLTLINDILDISRIEAERLELYPEEVHLERFLRGIASMIEMKAKQQGIAFRYQVLTPLPDGVRMDQKRVRQILLNVLGNAVKFTQEGAVTFRIQSFPSEREGNEARLRFEIEDTGVGISFEEQTRIFMPFEQAGEVQKRFTGTGLGLAISAQLVEAMGGTLMVKSEPGTGSTFWFDLSFPLVEIRAAQEPQVDRRMTGYSGPRRSILVADDHEPNRTMLVDLLVPLGFDVYEARDGREAVEQAKQLHPDVILMDLVMPEMTGIEAIHAIRGIPELSHVVILVESARVFTDDQRRCFHAGCDGFIKKPIVIRELMQRLKEHLHFEWTYETAAPETSHPVSSSMTDSVAPEVLVPPPAEELHVLLDLANTRRLGKIRKRAVRLEHAGEHYRAFAHKLQELAANLHTKEIQTLLEESLKNA